ncbi:unnamed protein product, partial [Amoebophrya sp. A25]
GDNRSAEKAVWITREARPSTCLAKSTPARRHRRRLVIPKTMRPVRDHFATRKKGSAAQYDSALYMGEERRG